MSAEDAGVCCKITGRAKELGALMKQHRMFAHLTNFQMCVARKRSLDHGVGCSAKAALCPCVVREAVSPLQPFGLRGTRHMRTVQVERLKRETSTSVPTETL